MHPLSALLQPHQAGLARPGDVSHMCPECGNPPAPFCLCCLGTGQVSTDRLDRWLRQVQSERA